MANEIFTKFRGRSIVDICELGCVADMVKDLATAYEKMAKAHYYLSEHSEEKY